MKWTSLRRLSTVAVTIAAVVAGVAIVPEPARAAGPRPLFQVPFPCGESWHLATYRGHDDYDIDMTANTGTTNGRPILASYGGIVAYAGWDSGGGWMVKLDHDSGWETLYLHMIESPPVRTGQAVALGQQIGRVGSTGDSSGPHLHYEQHADGNKVESWFNGAPSGITSDGDPRTGPLYIDGPVSAPVDLISRNGCGGGRQSVGDYDGDGRTDMALYRRDCTNGSAWWIYSVHLDRQIRGGTRYGGCGDIPAPGDYDGDGRTDMALYRRDCTSGSTWWIYSVHLDRQIRGGTRYGGCGDIPATAT